MILLTDEDLRERDYCAIAKSYGENRFGSTFVQW